MTATPVSRRLQFGVGIGAVAFLVLGAYVVLRPFLVPLAWAAVLAYATWPVYRRVLGVVHGRDLWAALLMLLLVILAVAGPVTFLSLALADDVGAVFRTLQTWTREPPALPSWVRDLPLIGSSIAGWYDMLHVSPGVLQQLFVERGSWVSQRLFLLAGDIGRNLARLGLTMFTLFFLYRYGEEVLAQTQRVMARLAGAETQRRLAIVGATIRAVCYGVLLTAVIQGTLAGLGFWAVGLERSVLLGALTALVALAPFGPPLVWLPAGLSVLLTDALWKGIALLLWGFLVVSSVDNILRPYLIGGPTQIPFLILFFGVLGGLAAFGLLGLFVGPVILAVLIALWREWAVAADASGRAVAGRSGRPSAG